MMRVHDICCCSCVYSTTHFKFLKSGDILVRLFSYEELANPVTEDFKDISNMVHKFVNSFVFDQMEKSNQDIPADTLESHKLVNSFVMKYCMHGNNWITMRDAINFLNSREACGLDEEGPISIPTHEDRIAYFCASLMYHINENKHANFKLDSILSIKHLFYNFATNKSLFDHEKNRRISDYSEDRYDRFTKTLYKVLSDPTTKTQFDMIRLHNLPIPDIDGSKVEPYPNEQHHRDGGDPDNTEETLPDEFIIKDGSKVSDHEGGDLDTAIPDAIGNVNKYTEKDLYDGSDDGDTKDDHTHPHHAVGGDPDPIEVKSWWQQFLKEHPSINKSLTYMNQHPVATAAGATLVALGMYGAAKLWKRYKEKKKQQLHNK